MEIIDPLLIAIQEFLKSKNFDVPDWFVELVLVLVVPLILFILNYLKKRIISIYRYRKNSNDLHPFYTNADITRAKKYYVPTKLRDKPPSNFDDLLMARTIDIDTPAINWFLNRAFDDKDDARFYLILADSGMGKTTFLINLYLEYAGKLFRKYDIKLYPIGHPQTFIEIEKLKEKGLEKNTILLLDAFDEDNKALVNWKERFDSIIESVQSFREVVITSRTQFFPSEVEEPYQTKIPRAGSEKGFHLINKMYISPFSKSDISLYLDKKFGKYNIFKKGIKDRANRIVNQSPSLMLRPMLLAYIDDLLESTTNYKYVFQIYEELVLKWISREANRIEKERAEEFRENLSDFSLIVAKKIYQNWIEGKKGLILTSDEIEEIAKRHNIKLNSLEMKSKSLLNRNVIGEYKFSHKSILEFLLAKECMINDEFGSSFNFIGFDQAQKFVAELSKVEYVLRFFKKSKIKVFTNYYDLPLGNSDRKVKKFMKSIMVNRIQLKELLLELDDNRFIEGINELFIQNIIILEDSQYYKIENLDKVKSLKRVTIYTSFKGVKDGRVQDIRKYLPHCYIPRW